MVAAHIQREEWFIKNNNDRDGKEGEGGIKPAFFVPKTARNKVFLLRFVQLKQV